MDKKTYDHNEQFEILYGKKWKYFPSISITIYLTGTAITKCIMTGNTLAQFFKDFFGEESIVASFYFWMGIFFVCGAIFSFRSINDTKVMQAIIIIVRVISILLLFFGAIYLIAKEGAKNVAPK